MDIRLLLWIDPHYFFCLLQGRVPKYLFLLIENVWLSGWSTNGSCIFVINLDHTFVKYVYIRLAEGEYARWTEWPVWRYLWYYCWLLLNEYGGIMFNSIFPFIYVSRVASYAQRKTKRWEYVAAWRDVLILFFGLYNFFLYQYVLSLYSFILLDINGVPCPLRQPGGGYEKLEWSPWTPWSRNVVLNPQ